MAKIYAPFTNEQVEELKQWQSGSVQVNVEDIEERFRPYYPGGIIPTHPFTCHNYEGCIAAKREDQGILIPSNEGWTCPCGKCKQDWCHDFMVK